jgi:iron complex outermembrane recepter protein
MTIFTSLNRLNLLSCLLGGVSVLSLMGVTGHASAQTQISEAKSLDEVVVTASRRSEKARDVPTAVSVISGEKLSILNSSGLDIRFLSARTPSLQIESSFGRAFPRFYIRGLGNTDFDVNAAQPVSVVYDDVALESPMLKSYPVFDLASVEVLRGPQGTLFGRNTPAGVVKLNSAAPSEVFGGYGSASYGTFGSINAEGAVTGPLASGFTGRLSGLIQQRDDWVKNTATKGLADKRLEGYADKTIRAQIAYKGEGFGGIFNVHARDLDGSPRIFRAGLFKKGSNRFANGFDVEKVSLDGKTSQALQSWGTNLRLNYEIAGLGTLYSVTGYETAIVESTGDIDGAATYGFGTIGLGVGNFSVNTGGVSKPKEFSQELRLELAPMGAWRTQIGLYVFEQNLRYNEISYTPAGVIDSNVLHVNLNKNWGAFASTEFTASEALKIRGGLRYASDKKKDLTKGIAALPAVSLPITVKVKGDNLSGDLSATYTVSPTVNIYGRLATGYQGPAIQDRVNFFSVPSTAKAQTTVSGEGGVKSVAYDRKVRLDVSAYYFVTKDIQLTAVGGANNSARLLNADKVLGYGFEADIEARPVPALALTLGGSYNFTEIQDKSIAVDTCGSGQCSVTNRLNSAGRALLDGNPLPQAPKWVGNITAKYSWPLASGAQVYVYTDWAYRSQINYFLYEAKEFRSRPSLIGGLRAAYITSGGTEFAVFGRNITDQIRAESAIDFNNLTGMVNDPQTLGVSVSKSF